MSPEQLLRELEGEGRIVVGDLEAGIGTLLRMGDGGADVALVVAQPTAKSVDVARRGAEVARRRGARVVLVANRVRGAGDVAMVRDAVGAVDDLVEVPDDDGVARADEIGAAPLDATAAGPAVAALARLARSLSAGAP